MILSSCPKTLVQRFQSKALNLKSSVQRPQSKDLSVKTSVQRPQSKDLSPKAPVQRTQSKDLSPMTTSTSWVRLIASIDHFWSCFYSTLGTRKLLFYIFKRSHHSNTVNSEFYWLAFKCCWFVAEYFLHVLNAPFPSLGTGYPSNIPGGLKMAWLNVPTVILGWDRQINLV